jgi:hypothetical protein
MRDKGALDTTGWPIFLRRAYEPLVFNGGEGGVRTPAQILRRVIKETKPAHSSNRNGVLPDVVPIAFHLFLSGSEYGPSTFESSRADERGNIWVHSRPGAIEHQADHSGALPSDTRSAKTSKPSRLIFLN